jgi:predicted DNA-binding transcriptional regulator AlpA
MSTRKAHSVDQSCSDHQISRAMFYKLRRAGKAPREMKIGTRTLISNEAAAEWRRAREAESAKSAVPFGEDVG